MSIRLIPRELPAPTLSVEEAREWLILHGHCCRLVANVLTAHQVIAAAESLRVMLWSSQ